MQATQVFSNSASSNIVLTQITVSTAIVALLQFLKQSKYFPWLSDQSTKATRVIAAIASAAAGVGIHFEWNHQAESVTITGLSLTAVGAFLWTWMKSHAVQEAIYRLYQATSPPKGQAEFLKLVSIVGSNQSLPGAPTIIPAGAQPHSDAPLIAGATQSVKPGS